MTIDSIVTTETFDPTVISMTPEARAHLRKQLQQEGVLALELNINESGCSGYMYEINYVSDRPEDSREFDFGDDVKVFISNENWQYISGTSIDFVTEGLNSSLKFDNPNADTLCGCGESFSIRGT